MNAKQTLPQQRQSVADRDEWNEGPEDGAERFSLIGGLFRLFFGFLFGLFRLVVLTSIVMGMVGAFSYFSVRKYIRGETAQVPLIVNQNAAKALSILSEHGLHLELDHQEYDEETPAGFILDQRPTPDTKVKKGSPVRVVLSSGPALISVPNVQNLDFKDAEIRLERAELRVGARSSVPSRLAPRGAVVATDPPPDAQVERDTLVNLLISIGSPRFEISMPNLAGRTVAEAEALLEPLGLRIAHLNQEPRPGMEPGRIFDQAPVSGSRVSPSATILVSVASGSG